MNNVYQFLDYASRLLEALMERRQYYPSIQLASVDAQRISEDKPPPLTTSFCHVVKNELIDRHTTRFPNV